MRVRISTEFFWGSPDRVHLLIYNEISTIVHIKKGLKKVKKHNQITKTVLI